MRPLFFMLPLLLMCAIAHAQITIASNAELQNLDDMVRKKLEKQLGLYNGTAYKEPQQSDDEYHPFYGSDESMWGSIVYDGQTFDSALLQFDLTSQKVVTEHYNGDRIALISERIQRFSMGSSTFVRLLKTESNGLPDDNFYLLLYNGKTQVVARQQKLKQDKFESGRLKIEFEEKIKYYVRTNNIYHEVKSKRSMLNVLAGEKQNLRQALKRNRISFSANRSAALSFIAQQYDLLKP